jgi:predicted nucleic acid-binding protein
LRDLIVADAGPLIGMARIGLLSLLKDLFPKVLIPPKVHDELQISLLRPGYEALAAALQEKWLLVEAPQLTTVLRGLKEVLDEGEAEAIALAEQRSAQLLIDEKRGREIARHRGVQIVGTGAVLLLAKEARLLDRVADALDRLAANGYRLAPSLRLQILQKAGEA